MSKARAVRLELRRGRAPDSRVQFDDEGDGVRFGWFVVVGRHVNVFECWRNSAGCEPRSSHAACQRIRIRQKAQAGAAMTHESSSLHTGHGGP